MFVDHHSQAGRGPGNPDGGSQDCRFFGAPDITYRYATFASNHKDFLKILYHLKQFLDRF
jgi:hypothetical protein